MKIRAFIDTVEGLAPNTRVAYGQTLWQLDNGIKGAEPTNAEIKSFLKRYTSSSLHRHKAAIKAYLEYTHPGEPWPFTSRQFAAVHEAVVRYVPVLVVYQLVDAAENEDDRMFVLTLFTLGCRINELMGIDVKDIKPAGVRVLSKGGTYRLKVITGIFYDELWTYASEKTGKLFPQSYTYYYKKLRVLAKKIGHSEVSPHMLRHARAVDLLNKGMELPFVQQFLGHANINTTARYLVVTAGELGTKLEEVENNGKKGGA